jgi:hypothetical protein
MPNIIKRLDNLKRLIDEDLHKRNLQRREKNEALVIILKKGNEKQRRREFDNPENDPKNK